ncbi:DUF1295-domain-containing protein [Daldinia caldariorum]|uniref:DUF1295-domain-containing protein n=1 Tax=Daldinia caldariorum TaxID=326644 RepID=UPI002007A626|nr:DUF1295-domain-containing protein [Daldinia caldariorum]KAI1470594.1 DUF1295-domain-containing protein [Daldinia caldariorum]
MADPNNDPKPWYKKMDLIQRGDRSPTPWGTLTFVGLRLADIPLQHALLAPAAGSLGTSLLARAGVATVLPAAVLNTGIPFLDSLGSPTGALLLLFACGSAAKQIYWQTVLSYESFPARAALAVALYNTLMNGANALLFRAAPTSALFSRPQVPLSLPFFSFPVHIPLTTIVGLGMYVSGLALETVSEAQRKAFKDRPENRGKVCKVGVWRWARHVNYLGYSLWRGGYTMVAAGWVAGLAVTFAQMWDLGHRAAGVLDDYCSEKYKEQWAQFKREVPYKILPGIY